MNSGRRVRAVALAAALVGSTLGAAAVGAVASAGPALAVPVGSEYPATWTVSGNVATGTSPSGVVVTATVTAPATFLPAGALVFTGPTPLYFPTITTQALHLIITGCTGPPCGSITYSFSQPVLTPVLYTGDIGTGSVDAGVFTDYHDSPTTLASGTFSLDSAGSETANMSVQDDGSTVGITDPAGEVGQSAVNPSSCGSFGCGVYDISTPTQTVTGVTMNFGYAGTGTSGDVFSQILGITPFVPAPALTLDKSVSPSAAAKAGTKVTFSYLVTNTGNVTLNSVHPADTSFSGTGTPSSIACPSTTLTPGNDMTCTASYTLTQPDVNAGRVTNTAIATGTPLGSPPVTSPPSSATVTIPAHPALVIKKSASPKSLDQAGNTVHYSYLVTDTGNVTLTGLKVNDVLAGLSAISCPSATLNPGKDMTCTASYVTTEADVQAGSIANTATATGDPPSGSPVVSGPSTVLDMAPPAPVQPGTPVPVTG
jgi:uncharacterized repeat protein (TIGR01451 family)